MDIDTFYSELPCFQKRVDDLDIDLDCIHRWKRVGIQYVGDVLREWDNNRKGHYSTVPFPNACRYTTYSYLDSINCWPWPEDLEKFEDYR